MRAWAHHAKQVIPQRPVNRLQNPTSLLFLQRTAGNQAVQALVQRAITVGQPPGQQRFDLKDIDGLHEQVVKRNAKLKKRSAETRNSLLVFHRNNRWFIDMGVLEQSVADRLADRDLVQSVDWKADEATITADHPERSRFLAAFAGVLPPDVIEELWGLTVKGVREQTTAHGSARFNNAPYRELARKFSEQLKAKAGAPLALWSGGYDVSMYAQERGFRTLEVTRAGKVYDQLVLCNTFSALGELWNSISRQFVASAFGEIHIFLRTLDQSSVLFRQELPELVQLEGVTAVKWHLMRGTNLQDLTEIDARGNPVASYTFSGYRDLIPLLEPSNFDDKFLKHQKKRELTRGEQTEIKELLEGERSVEGNQLDLLHRHVWDAARRYELDDETDPAKVKAVQVIEDRAALRLRNSREKIDPIIADVDKQLEKMRTRYVAPTVLTRWRREAETLAATLGIYDDAVVDKAVKDVAALVVGRQQSGATTVGDAYTVGMDELVRALNKARQLSLTG